MDDQTPGQLRRENLYLRQRVAQLESDMLDLSAQVARLQQERERLHGRRAAAVPNPLGGGQ
jgi:outer membrane murein-binding lipoprotein Lpp